jgi:hypothetical protein
MNAVCQRGPLNTGGKYKFEFIDFEDDDDNDMDKLIHWHHDEHQRMFWSISCYGDL